ncbi:MAG: S41 family peptidase [Bryobacteraceae bacterium]
MLRAKTALLLLPCLCAPAQDAARKSRLAAFEAVWSKINDHHYDPTFGGLDWAAVRRRYEPRAARAPSDDELHALLNQMIDELKLSHFRIIAAGGVVEETPQEPGGIGIEVKLVEGEATVTRVKAGSPAAASGLTPGSALHRIGSRSVKDILARVEKSGEPARRKRLLAARVLQAAVDGAPGSKITIAFADGKGATREVSLERVRKDGEFSPALGHMPPQYMEFESRRLEGGIGYIRLTLFAVNIMERLRAAVRSMSDAPGMIFDLRGNPGGNAMMTGGIAGLLMDRQTSLGVMQMRKGHINMAVFPQPGPYSGPLVVVTDSGSASASEIFAAGLQALGRAKVAGERSAGAALPSMLEGLPTGAAFQYAVADFKLPNGALVEGIGVVPDAEVPMTRRALLAGRDPQLDAAVKEVWKSREKKGEGK